MSTFESELIEKIWREWVETSSPENEELRKIFEKRSKEFLSLIVKCAESGEKEELRKFIDETFREAASVKIITIEELIERIRKLRELVLKHATPNSVAKMIDVIAETEEELIRKITSAFKEREERTKEVFAAIGEIAAFKGSFYDASEVVLEEILKISRSDYGFFGVVEGGILKVFVYSKKVMKDCGIEEQFKFPVKEGKLWAEAITSKKPLVINEFVGKLPEGHVKLENFLAIPVVRNGEVKALLGVANKKGGYDERDVRILKIFADQLFSIFEKEELRSLYTTLVETVKAGIILVDEDGRVLFANREVENMLEIPKEEIVGKYFYEFLPEDEKDKLMNYHRLRRSEPEKAPKTYETRITIRGKDKYLLVNVEVLPDGRTIAVMTDITKEVKREKELEMALKVLKTMHELDRKIIEGVPLKEIVKLTLFELTKIMGSEFDLAGVFEFNEKTGEFIPLYSEKGSFGFRIDELRDGDKLEKGEVVIVDDISSLKDPTDLEKRMMKVGVRSYIAAPLIVRNRLHGVLFLSSREKHKFRDVKRTIQEISDQIAIAIHEAKLFEMRLRAIRQIEENIERFAILVDKIKNPLAVILSLAEHLEKDVAKELANQVDRIMTVVRKLDEGWLKSEEVRTFLRRSWERENLRS